MEYSLRTQSRRYFSPTFRHIVLPFLLFGGLVIFAAFVRFNGITAQGTDGSDTFGYLKEAKLWADGKPPQFIQKMIFYRPAIYLLHSWVVRIGGWNDYSIKMLHAFMDMFNIGLIFLFAYILSKNWWNALSASLLYAFLPIVIENARSEQVQSPATTFILLSIVFFAFFQRHENSLLSAPPKTDDHKVYPLTITKGIFLFIAGFCLGVAANVRGDLAFLGPGFVIYLLFLITSHRQKYKCWLTFISYAFIFTLGFFTPYLIGVIGFGFKLVYFVMSREIQLHTDRAVNPLLLLKLFQNAFQKNFGNAIVITVLFFVLPVVMLLRRWKRCDDPDLAFLPFILILSYLGGSLITMSSVPDEFVRISFPLLPLVILEVNYWYYRSMQSLFGQFALPGWIVLVLALFLMHDKIPLDTNYHWGDKHSAYREVYDVIKDNVNSQNRLLITPVITYVMHQIYPGGFRSGIYFGSENAEYLGRLHIKDQYNVDTLTQLLSDQHIRFVFVSHDRLIDERMLDPKFMPSWTDNEHFTYSLQEDRKIVFQYIQRHNGRLIFYGYWGLLYELEAE